MALVVLLRGVNVGGYRRFRPRTLAEHLKHLGAVNIGAAGTFVVRRPVSRTQLRAELTRGLPFEAEIVICEGREILRLMSHKHFADQPVRPHIVRFVSVLSQRPRSAPSMPMRFPSSGLVALTACGSEGAVAADPVPTAVNCTDASQLRQRAVGGRHAIEKLTSDHARVVNGSRAGFLASLAIIADLKCRVSPNAPTKGTQTSTRGRRAGMR